MLKNSEDKNSRFTKALKYKLCKEEKNLNF